MKTRMKGMTAERASEILTPGKVENLTVQEVIDATEFFIPAKGNRGDVSSLCHFLTANESLTLDECIEIGNHFDTPYVWDALIMAAFYPFRRSRDIELKRELSTEQLKKMLEEAKNKDAVIEAITDRLNVLNRLCSNLSARESSGRGPIGWPSL